ncbi:hypothetical protein CCACVL1_03627, partial [Corchorus capsularis]
EVGDPKRLISRPKNSKESRALISQRPRSQQEAKI